MKRLHFGLYGSVMALLVTALMTNPLYAQIIADGNEHTVDAIGKTLDISLPNNPDIAFITFRLVGGDGGYAQVLDKIGGKVLKAKGGSGAYVIATFPVGNDPHEIPPGSIFRFMEGKSGQNGSSDAIVGSGEDFGGGGGGSGILYKENSTSHYKLLAVAGGGGGAFQSMFAGFSEYHKPGQSGRIGTSGGSGNGSQYSNAGGMDGHDGGNSSLGDGGGVRTATSSLRTSAYTHENCDNCTVPGIGHIEKWRAGGTGYGCGGHGLGTGFLLPGTGYGGGGGGGYSGGGFGGIVGRGGGGGSFVNPIATSYNFSDQGTDPTPDHGWITYQVTLNQRPVAKCISKTIYLDEAGLATLYPTDFDYYSSDPDGSIVEWSLSKTKFDCDDVGSNQVTLTVTDNLGSTATCTTTANMMDASAPTAVYKDITVQLDAAGMAAIEGKDVDGGSSDNCGIASMIVTPNTFDCSNIGTPVTVTLTVTDGSGNQSSCTAFVTVEDHEDPVITCPGDISVPNGLGECGTRPGICGAYVRFNATATDNCSAEVTYSHVPGSFFPIGTTTVTATATDPAGNTDVCTFDITVEDNEDPTITCPADITVSNTPGACGAVVSFTASATDNCSAVVTYSQDPGTFFPVGTTTVTATATDPSGNTAICTFDVTVEDHEDPTITCPADITVSMDPGTCGALVSFNATATDNCSAVVTYSQDPGTFFPVGTTMVAATATDPSGNTIVCTFNVTVEDNEAPVSNCKPTTVQLDAHGEGSIVPADVDRGSTDNCQIQSMTVSPNTFTCADVGNVTITLTVTDIYGNNSSCETIVTVEDNVPPVAMCQNITIQLDKQGEATIVPTDMDGGSTDACGIASYEVSKTDFTCVDLGLNTVTLTITDVNGNYSTCQAEVQVEDNTKPIVRTQNVTIVLDKEGEGHVTPQMIDHGSSDNCIIVDRWLEGMTNYDCGVAGEHEVVLKVKDQSGNVGSANAFVTVKFYEPNFSNIHGVANGDTIHRVDCQVPWDISFSDLVDYRTITRHGSTSTQVYKEDLPENAPWGMYALWRYEYVVKDACYHTYTFNYYLALYDLAPPVFQNFPSDTVVAKPADVPPVDMEVKIIDVCQYVVWDTVVTMPVLHPERGDTLGYTRRWMARDPSGHESFRDQMIWLGSGDRNLYSLITGRIADKDHLTTARFAGEAGTNGLPVSLYRLDTDAGMRTRVSSWTTGDWLGAQGTYYFVPELPGMYQVKIDTAICLVDTLKFNRSLWSDTLSVAAGESLYQGWIIRHECVDAEPTETDETQSLAKAAVPDQFIQNQIPSDKAWRVYPNPAKGYLRLDINTDDQLSYRIYDALGRSVKSGVCQLGQTIDVRGLNSGMYHLQLQDQKELLGTKRVLLME
ncbi:HYR domain-containing protein [Membranicola marinus]|uniref:HYR domain-containing protein n=1 Tax=Membranihabitans marinus TaxID=1227546 RepID=A0A953HQV7_9BACT|nr:HYR domain-containing protein [Membranihabitans marinus]MBY5956725.1 HYR domain-containing protein [Membranihabitans marinus]